MLPKKMEFTQPRRAVRGTGGYRYLSEGGGRGQHT